ncbi:hypothetical protein [uncultured Pseudomonas sp.]|uniref:hypothetical protein n=1 Tax=uncultured Pseudomonas sp. TaxID=114707 RepID=UPI002590EF76|nr:hypothetical protein [uncultured Pseudomonas sp.]
MADLTLPEVITRFRGNEARITDFANGNAAGYYITTDGKKVETLPSVVSRLAAAIAAASATADTLKGTGGAKLIGFGASTVDAALASQAKGIADNAKAVAVLDAGKLAKGGGTMTGALKLAGDPTDPLHAASKGWAETLIGTYWKPAVGDLLTTARGAPDSTWIPDGANYLQASYPALFAKLGLLQSDGSSQFSVISSDLCSGFMGIGKDGVFIMAPAMSSSQTIKRSNDGGATFSTITSPINYLYNLTTDGKGIWIGTGSDTTKDKAMMKSTDNGLTWAALTFPKQYNAGRPYNDGNGTWIITLNSGYLRSIDNGVTWAEITIFTAYSLYSDGAGVWYATQGGSAYVFKSTDNALTWTQLPTQLLGGGGALNSLMVGGTKINGTTVLMVHGYWVPYNSSTYYYVWNWSADGINWRQVNTSGAPASAGNILFGRDGVALAPCYTGGLFRWTGIALDPTHASGVSMPTNAGANLPSVVWPGCACTDGSTWYVGTNSSGGTARAAPAYDVKTQFRVPKSLAQPAPFATFVKAK